MIIPKFDVETALKSIHKHNVTIISEFAPMLDSLLDAAEKENCDLSSMRVAIGLDNPETMKRFEDVTGGRFWTGYGQAETAGFITLAPFFLAIFAVSSLEPSSTTIISCGRCKSNNNFCNPLNKCPMFDSSL